MARKRKESLEGQITIGLQPEELIQLKNICIIRMENNLEQFCRKLILEGIKRETTDILSSVALSYQLEQDVSRYKDANHLTNEEMDEFFCGLKVPQGDQETDLSSLGRTRDACGPVSDLSSVEARIRGNNLNTTHLDGLAGSSTGRISSCQGNISEHAPALTQADFSDGLIKFGPIALDMSEPIKFDVKPWLDPDWSLTTKDLDDQGLRGGEADEESLHGTRNADLDLPRWPTSKDITAAEYICRTDEQGTERANMQSELAALHADDPRARAASKILAHHQYGNDKGHEVDQYANGPHETSITNTEPLKGEEDEG